MESHVLFLLCAATWCATAGYVFRDLCDVKQALGELDFISARYWTCLIYYGSNMNTSKVHIKSDGSKSYGVFQINNKEWCGEKNVGGRCEIACSSLIDDEISDDFTCARKIHSIYGFPAWLVWLRNCEGRHLNFIDSC